MFKEYDVVRLKRQVQGIPKGAIGTIVITYSEDAREVMVEFPGWNDAEFPAVDVNIDDLELKPNDQTPER